MVASVVPEHRVRRHFPFLLIFLRQSPEKDDTATGVRADTRGEEDPQIPNFRFRSKMFLLDLDSALHCTQSKTNSVLSLEISPARR